MIALRGLLLPLFGSIATTFGSRAARLAISWSDRATGTITIRKADETYSRTLAAGREAAVRYRRTLAALAK